MYIVHNTYFFFTLILLYAISFIWPFNDSLHRHRSNLFFTSSLHFLLLLNFNGKYLIPMRRSGTSKKGKEWNSRARHISRIRWSRLFYYYYYYMYIQITDLVWFGFWFDLIYTVLNAHIHEPHNLQALKMMREERMMRNGINGRASKPLTGIVRFYGPDRQTRAYVCVKDESAFFTSD